MAGKVLIDAHHLKVMLNRLCCQLIENHDDFKDTVLIGLQPRGVQVAKRLVELLEGDYGCKELKLGFLDITFFRDDFGRRKEPLQANQTQIDFLVEDKKVVFIDDVLYTGRSVRAALDAIHSFGRPRNIELMVLIDRRFSRDLPKQPNYSGARVDAIESERVVVDWKETEGEDVITITNEHT
ncbi:MAG: bifunctional pyr operon transcriptional regulator/uracil phosphoribosyltransferase PyrR, partial [Schleiferiaceae bacterium]|nr:bifunctional pyr operon transcriptional regulator/uracil phosphoribosyltransferase PyrR [Schleiferiaceae bacterium]